MSAPAARQSKRVPKKRDPFQVEILDKKTREITFKVDEARGENQPNVEHVERDLDEKKGEDIFHGVLRRNGWHYSKGSGLSGYAYIAPGFKKSSATRGITLFASCKAIAKQAREDGDDGQAIIGRAAEALAERRATQAAALRIQSQVRRRRAAREVHSCRMAAAAVRIQSQIRRRRAAREADSCRLAAAAIRATKEVDSRRSAAATAAANRNNSRRTSLDPMAAGSPQTVQTTISNDSDGGDDEEEDAAKKTTTTAPAAVPTHGVEAVEAWLLRNAPEIAAKDARRYARTLVGESFDCEAMIVRYLKEEHLEAMDVGLAHRLYLADEIRKRRRGGRKEAKSSGSRSKRRRTSEK